MFKTTQNLKVSNWIYNNCPIISYLHKLYQHQTICTSQKTGSRPWFLFFFTSNDIIPNLIQCPVILPLKYFLYQFTSLYPNYLYPSSNYCYFLLELLQYLPSCKSLPVASSAHSISPWSTTEKYFYLQPFGTRFWNLSLIALTLLHKSNQWLPNTSGILIKTSVCQ